MEKNEDQKSVKQELLDKKCQQFESEFDGDSVSIFREMAEKGIEGLPHTTDGVKHFQIFLDEIYKVASDHLKASN